jgi:hypothetical protein
MDLRGRVDLELGEDVALGLGDLAALPEGAGWSGKGLDVDAVELMAQLWPAPGRQSRRGWLQPSRGKLRQSSARLGCSEWVRKGVVTSGPGRVPDAERRPPLGPECQGGQTCRLC